MLKVSLLEKIGGNSVLYAAYKLKYQESSLISQENPLSLKWRGVFHINIHVMQK